LLKLSPERTVYVRSTSVSVEMVELPPCTSEKSGSSSGMGGYLQCERPVRPSGQAHQGAANASVRFLLRFGRDKGRTRRATEEGPPHEPGEGLPRIPAEAKRPRAGHWRGHRRRRGEGRQCDC